MTTSRPALVSIVLLLLAGCGSTTPPPTGDCASDPSKCGCTGDSQCSAPTPRCDTHTKRCVPCLPVADNCGVSMHCVIDASGNRCLPRDRCAAAVDCPEAGGKPGLCCDGTCSDPQNDASNCSACGKACPAYANATSGCMNGSCGITACAAGFGDCDVKSDNGCEIDLNSDVKNCGACGTACKGANTSPRCMAGKCVFDCSPDFADCDGNPANGCETSTSTNASACGGCGKTCAALPNTTSVACVGGTCVVGACTASFFDCNHKPDDGCESDSQNDPANCNGCGKQCPPVDHGSPGCSGGGCGVGKCNANFGDCDGNVLNGCEQDLSSDKNNCGACAKVCPAVNGVAACQGGACKLVSCNQGFADCDLNPANGCEVPVSNDLKNCGGCAMVCPVPANATAQCSNGVCGIGSCIYGWSDCNMSLNDGCESNVLLPNNCGACGLVCAVPAHGVAACKAAACAIGSCNAGFADCDMNLGNGCEADLSGDIANCGACGMTCSFPNGVAACVAKVCQLASCNKGFADCNLKAADGCEQDIAGDVKNCGACGKACPAAGAICKAGVCACPGAQGIVCNNACIDAAADAKNCGACGNVCGMQTPYCSAGKCTANPCTGNVGGHILQVMGMPYLGYCWYLSVGGATCDQVCADSGGINMANDAIKALPDDCTGGGVGQPATWFYENGNAEGWLGPYGVMTGYRTLGHGYTGNSMLGRVQRFDGRCDQGGIAGCGTFPGDVNDTALNDNSCRSVVCACDH